MITIEQLLESVDLDFEPRWVTKDQNGMVWLWEKKPQAVENWWDNTLSLKEIGGKIKLSEFANKNWTKCIYEVPRWDNPDGQILKLQEDSYYNVHLDVLKKINELVAAVNELKERTEPKKLTGFAKTLSDLDMSKPMSSYTNKGE